MLDLLAVLIAAVGTVVLFYDWLRGQWAIARLDAEARAGQRRDGNAVMWWRLVGVDEAGELDDKRLFRTEQEANAACGRYQSVIPWWVWDGKDPFHPFGKEDRA